MTFTPKFKKHVTVPLLKMEKNVPYYVRFETAMTVSKPITSSRKLTPEEEQAKALLDSKNPRKEPPVIAQVTNLETKQRAQIICPAVLVSELRENYAGEGYVGKCFELVQHRVEGKSYNLVNITEIADPTDDEEAAKADAEPPKAARRA